MNTEPLTGANRLAYTVLHEAQKPSSSGTRAQGRTGSDEEDDSRAAVQSCEPSSQSSLEKGERKERVTRIRRPYLTRSSFQKGYVFTRTTERGTVHVIRYRVRSADGKWRHKAETVNTPRRKDAERILAERLREVNRGLRLPVEITFAEYAAGHWGTYISQNLKPSTQASHRSNVNTHLLPMFGKRRLSEISPVQVMDLLKDKAAGGLKPKSLLNLYVLLQKMLNLAVALELLNSNPMQRVPKAQGGANREAVSLSSSRQDYCGQHASESEGTRCASVLDGVANRGGIGSEVVGRGLRSVQALCSTFGLARQGANAEKPKEHSRKTPARWIDASSPEPS